LYYRKFFEIIRLSILVILFIISGQPLLSQFFVKVTDASNPIVTEGLTGNYIGASWVDIDNDERLDLYVSRKDIFKNLGNGNFTKLVNSIPFQGLAQGNSWADYDNDGYIDFFAVSTNQTAANSHLFRNNGNGTFSKILTGSIADSVANTGWGCVWGDINNDAHADLLIVAASGFGGVNHPNRLFYNNGDGTFTRIDTTDVTAVNDAYTVPMFSDFDQDGDIDIFIGTGPANNIGDEDYLYRNLLKEQNVPYFFDRIDTGDIGTDIVDGQNWNWIDIDNDGDLDGFLTNYSQSINNRLYRCEGPYYYVKMTSAEVGTIVSDPGAYLTNTWGDFDNDGDIDCFVTNDAGLSKYYTNNGSGFFTRIDTLSIIVNGQSYGAVSGDYDNDGDLDMFIAGTNATRGLHRNETNNNNKWVNIKCVGSGPAGGFSNKTALGTIVKIKAVINNNPVWQIREVNAQNSFNSMNALNVHFGLGNATVIDSLIIKWPRGLVQTYTNVTPERFYKAIEGQGLNEIVIGITQTSHEVPGSYSLSQNYPNPFNPVTRIRFELPTGGNVTLDVYDVTGRKISTLLSSELKAGTYETDFDGFGISSGVYFYRLSSGDFIETKKMLMIK